MQPMDAAAPPADAASDLAQAPAASSQGATGVTAQQQPQPPSQQQQQQQPPMHPSASQVCPPFGSKSVIGRRAKMEDACVAVPYLVEVPVSRAGVDELLPPRIAPQLRGSASQGVSGLSGAPPGRADGSISSSATPATGGSEQQQQQQAAQMAAEAMLTEPARQGAVTDRATETLHFFGVFDGHGGADAALHCAKSLHERVRDALSTCAAGPSSELLALRSKDPGGGGVQPAAQPQADVQPQASSSGNSGQQPGGSSSQSGVMASQVPGRGAESREAGGVPGCCQSVGGPICCAHLSATTPCALFARVCRRPQLQKLGAQQQHCPQLSRRRLGSGRVSS